MDERHWDEVYRSKGSTQVSWYRPRLDRSLALLERAQVSPNARVLDVGGGAATLVDELLARGATDVTVLDLSAVALAAAQQRLGASAARVRWLQGDVLTAELPAQGYDVWHDRAVFHFFTEAAAQARYVAQLRRALAPGGLVVVAAFAEDGPSRCSGLPVQRHSPSSLAAALGEGFLLLEHGREEHRTPGGATQPFVNAAFRGPGAPPALGR